MRRDYLGQDCGEEAQVDMTPMLDIVFIMLIFFIVTTSFVKESGIEVNRPEAATAQRVEHGNILVGIKADGEVWIDRRPVDIAAVRAHIERLHAQNPEGAVVIVADKASENGILVQVMDQVQLAGVTEISLAATKE